MNSDDNIDINTYINMWFKKSKNKKCGSNGEFGRGGGETSAILRGRDVFGYVCGKYDIGTENVGETVKCYHCEKIKQRDKTIICDLCSSCVCQICSQRYCIYVLANNSVNECFCCGYKRKVNSDTETIKLIKNGNYTNNFEIFKCEYKNSEYKISRKSS